MAADGSYSYNPTSIPTLETLSLGDHVETFNYSIADGHGDVSSSTLAITVHITPETVTASPDVNDVNEERSEERRVGKEGRSQWSAEADEQEQLEASTKVRR